MKGSGQTQEFDPCFIEYYSIALKNQCYSKNAILL